MFWALLISCQDPTRAVNPKAFAQSCWLEEASEVGKLEGEYIGGITGMVASQQHPGVYFAHGDAADGRITAFDRLGRVQGEWWVNTSNKWEDVTRSLSGDLLFLSYTDSFLNIERVAEPDPQDQRLVLTSSLVSIPSQGQVFEALVADPLSGRVYAISRGPEATLFQLDLVQATMSPVATIDAEVVAADLSGDTFAVSAKGGGVTSWSHGGDLAATLETPRCEGPGAGGRDRSLALDPHGMGYLIASDDEEPVITAVRPIQECPAFTAEATLGTLEAPSALEISGLAASPSAPGVFWGMNDGGGDGIRNVIIAFDQAGNHLVDVVLDGVDNFDWEDMAMGPGPSGHPHLYVADIGDNPKERDHIEILRFEEPWVDADWRAEQSTLQNVEVLRFVYDDGVPRNAETLLVDPVTGALLVVSKPMVRGEKTAVFLAEPPFEEGRDITLAQLFDEDLALGLHRVFTGGDISPAGQTIALVEKGGSLQVFPRTEGEAPWMALQGPGCEIALAPAHHESVALTNSRVVLVPEGEQPEIVGFDYR